MRGEALVVRVTIEDVARAAGVSRQTVSRALNNKTDISADTRRRVLAAVEELQYRPNLFARGMKTRRSNVVGLVISDISNPFYPAVARGVFDAAEASGRSVVVYNTDASGAREAAALLDLQDRGADGAVGFFYALGEDDLVDYGGRLPLVIADRYLSADSLSSVTSDFAAGTTAAVDHLVAKGHRRIGMLDSSVGVAVDERRTAFLAAARAHGLDGMVMVDGPPTIAGGAAGARELLSRDPSVTAVFAFNDLMALGATEAAAELGRAVPDELAVVGFDDLAFSRFVRPALTTVHTDKYGQGRTLVDVLLTAGQPRRIVLPASLITRDSA